MFRDSYQKKCIARHELHAAKDFVSCLITQTVLLKVTSLDLRGMTESDSEVPGIQRYITVMEIFNPFDRSISP